MGEFSSEYGVSCLSIYLSIYLSMHTATPSFLSITRRAALRWRKARTYLGIPGYACETTGPARRQPDHIHMDRLTQLQTENISVLVRREPVPHWYATQSQKTDALPLSHGGSPYECGASRLSASCCLGASCLWGELSCFLSGKQ